MVWCRWQGISIQCPYTQYSVRNLNGHGFLAPFSKKIPQVSPNNARLSIEGSLVISDFDQHIHPPMVCIFASGQANTISQWDPQPSKLVSYPRGQESARNLSSVWIFFVKNKSHKFVAFRKILREQLCFSNTKKYSLGANKCAW